MFTMADNERRKLTWTIKKRLFNLSSDELQQLATFISQEPAQAKLVKQDEEGCTDYLCSYMESTDLLESDDFGVSKLHDLLKISTEIIAQRSKSDAATAGVDIPVVSDVSLHLLESGHTDTHVTAHATEPHSDTATVDLVAQTESLELQISKLMSTYDELRQKVRQGGASLTPHTITHIHPTDSRQSAHSRPYITSTTQPTDSHQSRSSHTPTDTHHPPIPTIHLSCHSPVLTLNNIPLMALKA